MQADTQRAALMIQQDPLPLREDEVRDQLVIFLPL